MNEFLAITVKSYSYFREPYAASVNRTTPSPHLNIENWTHFNSQRPAVFKIYKQEAEQSMLVLTFLGSAVLEEVILSSLNKESSVQFTTRSPLISCKYLMYENNALTLRRFQLELNNHEDFVRLNATLVFLGFSVKQARGAPAQQSMICSQIPLYYPSQVTGFQVYDTQQVEADTLLPKSDHIISQSISANVNDASFRNGHITQEPILQPTSNNISLQYQSTADKEKLSIKLDNDASIQESVTVIDNSETNSKPLKDKNVNSPNHATKTSVSKKKNYKISKRLIKEKMKDQDFIKWVDKVEKVMKEMAKHGEL